MTDRQTTHVHKDLSFYNDNKTEPHQKENKSLNIATKENTLGSCHTPCSYD